MGENILIGRVPRRKRRGMYRKRVSKPFGDAAVDRAKLMSASGGLRPRLARPLFQFLNTLLLLAGQ